MPSGKSPHYDASTGKVYGFSFGSVKITASSAEELVDQFIAAPYTVEENPYYAQGPGLEGGWA